MNPDTGDLYGGLSGVTIEVNRFHLDGGVTISTTFAHLMCPLVLAFSPAPQGQAHSGPWKEAEGGFGFDLSTEIFVPKAFNWPKWVEQANTIWWIAALLRLKATPRLGVPVISNVSFSEAAATNQQVRFWPVESESQRTRMVLDLNAGHRVTLEHLEWLRQHWINAGHLVQQHAEFSLAARAFDNCSFVLHAELALLQLWGALEALFSPGSNELRFRISANVATFLEPPGAERHSLQNRVAKLYDLRSAAAHGRTKLDFCPFEPLISPRQVEGEVLPPKLQNANRQVRQLKDIVDKPVPLKLFLDPERPFEEAVRAAEDETVIDETGVLEHSLAQAFQAIKAPSIVAWLNPSERAIALWSEFVKVVDQIKRLMHS